MDERAFIRLEMKVEDMEKDLAGIQSEMKEMFGLLKSMEGAMKVNIQFDQIAKRFESLEQRLERFHGDNSAQERSIGEIVGVVGAIKEALSRSRDSSVASAMQGITINVEGGKGEGGRGGEAKSFGGDNNGEVIGGNKTTS